MFTVEHFVSHLVGHGFFPQYHIFKATLLISIQKDLRKPFRWAWVMKQEVTATAGTSCRCSDMVLRRQLWRAGMSQQGNFRALRHVYCLLVGEIITVSPDPPHHQHFWSRRATRRPLSGFRRKNLKECGVLLGVSPSLHSSGFLLFGICVFP